MGLIRLAAASCAFLLLANPAFAQSEEDVMAQIESLHGMSEEFGEFFGQVQDAFLFDNPTALIELAAYPLTVRANDEAYDVETAQDFADNFDDLLTGDTRDALAGQDFAALIVTGDGVGFGDGVLWAANVCADEDCSSSQWQIISINN